MSSCVNWIVLTVPHYDSSASVSMLVASPIPWCQLSFFSMVSNCPFFPWCQIVLFTSMVLKLSRILHIMIPLRWSLCWWSPDVGTDDGSREDWFALNRWFCPKPDQIKSHRTRPSCATTYTTPSCFNVSSDHSLVQQYASKNNLNCLIIFS